MCTRFETNIRVPILNSANICIDLTNEETNRCFASCKNRLSQNYRGGNPRTRLPHFFPRIKLSCSVYISTCLPFSRKRRAKRNRSGIDGYSSCSRHNSLFPVVGRSRDSDISVRDIPVVGIQFTVHGFQFTVYGSQFTVYSLQFTVYSLQFTVYSLQFAVYSLRSDGKLWMVILQQIQVVLPFFHLRDFLARGRVRSILMGRTAISPHIETRTKKGESGRNASSTKNTWVRGPLRFQLIPLCRFLFRPLFFFSFLLPRNKRNRQQAIKHLQSRRKKRFGIW